MCDFEEFLFTCNHSAFRLKSFCHFARNDPYHQCYGVKVLRNSWQQGKLCDDCLAERQRQASQVQASSSSNSQRSVS
ncbi:hypothetical protein CP532_5354 [Ophiocordyceps camponoti-leonardi (nom. inval.)]|nr:hypothetical protein CP532_5354 [Ophiocordyceps camponoti-leonardi (nom. inval.)]